MRLVFAISLSLLASPSIFAAQEESVMLSLTSSAFAAGQAIPKKYTCEGGDLSPPLAWSGVPANAKSLALIVDDPDAPDPKAPQRVWVHWVVYNLAPATIALAEGASGKNVPVGAVEGTNDWGRSGYGGPCPPDRPASVLLQTLRARRDVTRRQTADEACAGSGHARTYRGAGGIDRDVSEGRLDSALRAFRMRH